ncbi:putative lipid II flippase FtsW [Marinicella sp. S1101]|uniref:putative lipid II flippase FtsW n=1 Tax=Marinicella marina TaxID=2996016 RepID=UPI0022610332|nr:putative lipid II flippase FtsW [Marinicella marina]MCX7553882.1 putative lipid II flippase FtsW [Marinicella marina]MDJ1140374.1 putative lipid II flippase FtsW [Marinicella marina]
MTTKQNKKVNANWYIVGIDVWLGVAFVMLLAIGAVMVASSSIAVAENSANDPFYYFKRHILFIGLGGLVGVLVMNISSGWMNRLSRPALILGILALVLVLIPGIGVEVNGARRWINLGISRFQVVEAIKLALIMSLASYIVKHKKGIQNSMVGVLKPLLVVVVIAGLLLVQPDFGSAVLLLIITLIMVYIAGARYRDLTLLGMLAGSAMMVIAWAEPYRVKRLVNFVDPWQDPFNAGFQLVQALIAVGRGEVTGVGIGSSIQKLFYLPEAHTDFIFAVYAEEMGFLGVLLLIGLFLLLIYRIFKIARDAFDQGNDYAGFICTGIAVWLALQAFLSMGVNLGMLPTKGLTLPFISSGGSAIMMNIIALSVVFRISYENRKVNFRSHQKEAVA